MKFLEFLNEAEKNITAIDHLLYVTYPIVKDKRLLMKILKESKNSIFLCISAILQYEYIHKKIRLYEDSRKNFEIFSKSSKNYHITGNEIKQIMELIDIVERHKGSSMEFYRKGSLVILSENLPQKLISIEKTKSFLALAKEILKKTKNSVVPRE